MTTNTIHVDVVSTLRGRMQDSGRFTDDTASGDMSNQFTQSLAVLGLDRAGAVPDKAVDFLAKSRCEDGGYPLTFKSDPAKSAAWNRGAYLVEGLGHCSACHSPRNALGGLEKDKAWPGATIGGWFPPNLPPALHPWPGR